MDYLQNIKDLESLIERFHNREGTFNFHYSGFSLDKWDPSLQYSMKKTDYKRMGTEDYVVVITYLDNSFSSDSYWVLLNDIIEWGEKNAG
jgi:hypothetical protein